MLDPDATRLAVLIDADNATPSLTAELLGEVSKYGTPTVRRAYGDWTTPALGGWKKELARHAIQPIQQFANTKGKNATDSALIIDAMDLLYAGNLEGFAIVSSDSDYTRLATRLRESGRTVFGFGERKTPTAFVAACDRFVYLDLLAPPTSPAAPAPDQEPPRPKPQKLLEAAVANTAKDDGWSHVSEVGSYLRKNDAAFDAREYGHQKLGDLLRAQAYVEVAAVASGTGQLKVRLEPADQRR